MALTCPSPRRMEEMKDRGLATFLEEIPFAFEVFHVRRELKRRIALQQVREGPKAL